MEDFGFRRKITSINRKNVADVDRNTNFYLHQNPNTMSMPGHFKIPGHSGTAIKHRKGFLKQKELLRNKQRVSGSTTLPSRQHYNARNTQSAHPLLRKLFLLLRLMLFIACGFLINSIIASEFENYQKNWKKEQVQRKADIQLNYLIILNNAYAFLEEGSLNAAQKEFELAMKLVPNDRRAIEGMADTLVKQCQELEANCDAARAYVDYLEGRGR